MDLERLKVGFLHLVSSGGAGFDPWGANRVAFVNARRRGTRASPAQVINRTPVDKKVRFLLHDRHTFTVTLRIGVLIHFTDSARCSSRSRRRSSKVRQWRRRSRSLREPGFDLKPDPNEVADVFEVPLEFLMNPQHHQRRRILSDDGERLFFAMPWRSPDTEVEYFIWGATAAMLRNLYRMLSA